MAPNLIDRSALASGSYSTRFAEATCMATWPATAQLISPGRYAEGHILLRIEKYPHRMNFNSGILESRKLHYKHLSKLLRPIPLNTPAEIDLTPKLSIRVTLLDANHCTGAVMFLIEGDGKAILYTGDIRAESWWVDSLIRHPILIPYTSGIKRLDKIYLDTTFAHTSHTPHTFPTKAEGIAELLRKLEPYPENTNFYFRAWTFGYEEVWMALAAALKSKASTFLSLDSYGMKDAHEMPLEELVNILSRGPLSEGRTLSENLPISLDKSDRSRKPLPRTIRFPYSRHSSYAELCELVKVFKPRDIHPCTVDHLDWCEDVSMESLFGHLCSDNKFVHDQYMRDMTVLENGEHPRKRRRRNPESSSQPTQQSTVTENSTTSHASQRSQVSIQTGREINGAVPELEAQSCSLSSDPPPIRPTIASSSSAPPAATIAQPLEQIYHTTNNASNNGSNSDSLPIPNLSPRTAKARRDTIRQAWHYLNDAQKSQSSQFHLGSLPSSWSTNGEISGLRLSNSEEQDVRELDEGSSSEPIVSTVRQGKPPLPTSTGAKGINVDGAIDNTESDLYYNTISETDNDNDSVTETDTKHQTNQHHFSQYSISSSAFASQSQSQIQGQLAEDFDEETISEKEHVSDAAQELVDPYTDPAPASALQLESVLDTRNRSQARHPFLATRESSIQNRRAAYQAAREDNYDAWAEMSLVSAGNNHTEEEIEL
ncbi:hypothetical protein BDW72DRAFT_203236 [Aspergillus terricola var. indicus]